MEQCPVCGGYYRLQEMSVSRFGCQTELICEKCSWWAGLIGWQAYLDTFRQQRTLTGANRPILPGV
jgi:hypothetical protein